MKKIVSMILAILLLGMGALADGEAVLREAGKYAYTTDLATGETTLEILPLA